MRLYGSEQLPPYNQTEGNVKGKKMIETLFKCGMQQVFNHRIFIE
jgi:hypothetical protein